MAKKKTLIVVFCALFCSSVLAFAQGFDTGITGYEEPKQDNSELANDVITQDYINDLVENNPGYGDGGSTANTPEKQTPQIESDLLTGDTKLACEAILCLSSPTRPGECSLSINRYFSISAKKWKDTVKKRKNFLNLCPSASADNNMVSLTDTLANNAGLCTVDQLNNQGQSKTDVSRVSLNYNQCRSAGTSRITAPSGKMVTISHEWISPNESTRQNKGYCQKTENYFKVNSFAPAGCIQLWNHLYTDFKDTQRPKVVVGEKPWDTHWVE